MQMAHVERLTSAEGKSGALLPTLMLRSVATATRLEAWRQVRSVRPSFETPTVAHATAGSSG